MRKILIIVLVLVGSCVYAQDTYYTQFFANKLDLNPAFAGSRYHHRVIANYRNQWDKFNNPFMTYAVSYDCYMDNFGGLGIQIQQDRQANGAQITTSIAGVYSYMMKISHNTALRFAISCGVINNHLDPTNLVYSDMIDIDRGFIGGHDGSSDPVVYDKKALDVGVGALFNIEKYTFGVSAKHLSEPSIAFTTKSVIPIKYVFHAGAEYPISFNGLRDVAFTFCPLFMFQMQDDNKQMNYGFYINKFNLSAGTWFRQNFKMKYDSMIFMLAFDNKFFRLGYSYDLAVNRLTPAGGNVHELSLIFLFGSRKKSHRASQVPCPRFFGKQNYLEL